MTIDLTPDDILFLRDLIETYPLQGSLRTLDPVRSRMLALLAKLTPPAPEQPPKPEEK